MLVASFFLPCPEGTCAAGWVMVIASTATTVRVNSNNCSPRHLPHLDPDIDPVLVGTDVDHIVCEVCDKEEPESHLLLIKTLLHMLRL